MNTLLTLAQHPTERAANATHRDPRRNRSQCNQQEPGAQDAVTMLGRPDPTLPKPRE